MEGARGGGSLVIDMSYSCRTVTGRGRVSCKSGPVPPSLVSSPLFLPNPLGCSLSTADNRFDCSGSRVFVEPHLRRKDKVACLSSRIRFGLSPCPLTVLLLAIPEAMAPSWASASLAAILGDFEQVLV